MKRQQELDLSGKVALITGASRGIGKRTALTLARRGVNLVVAARTVDRGVDVPLQHTIGQTVEELESFGVKALAVPTDLSKEEDLTRLVRAAMDQFGGVDILINNAASTAGHGWFAPIDELPRADWLYQFAVNLHAPFTLLQLVMPSMQERGGGRILNVSTESAEAFRLPEEKSASEHIAAGKFIHGDHGAYMASKRALDRFANVIAPYLAQKNIFVITMDPGHVLSEITEYYLGAGWRPSDSSSASSSSERLTEAASKMISMDVPARLLTYFAGCEDPMEYAGRVFSAGRDFEALGLAAA